MKERKIGFHIVVDFAFAYRVVEDRISPNAFGMSKKYPNIIIIYEKE